MSRSVKKGPFIQEALLKRVQEMNKTGDKNDDAPERGDESGNSQTDAAQQDEAKKNGPHQSKAFEHG